MKQYFVLVFLFSRVITSDLLLQPADLPLELFEKVCNDKKTIYVVNQLDKTHYNLMCYTNFYRKFLEEKAYNFCKTRIKNAEDFKDYYNIIKFPKFVSKNFIFKKKKDIVHENNRKVLRQYYQEVYPALFLDYGKYKEPSFCGQYKYRPEGFKIFHKNHPDILERTEHVAKFYTENIQFTAYYFNKINKKIIFIVFSTDINFSLIISYLQTLLDNNTNNIVRIVLVDLYPYSISYYKYSSFLDAFQKKGVEIDYKEIFSNQMWKKRK